MDIFDKSEKIDIPVGLQTQDIACELYRQNGEYYLTGNLTDKGKILNSLYTDTLDYLSKTEGTKGVEDYIIVKATGLHKADIYKYNITTSNLITDRNIKIYAIEYIDYCKGGQKALHQKETENEMYKRYLSDKLENATGLKSSFPDIFNDKREELVYILLYHDYTEDIFEENIYKTFTRSEVGDIVSFIREYENLGKADSLCKKAVDGEVSSHKNLGRFCELLESYDKKTLIRLFYEGKIKLDTESLAEDTKDIYNPLKERVEIKYDRFVYTLTDTEAKAYEFFIEREKNLRINYEIKCSIKDEALGNDTLGRDTIRAMIEKQCEKDNIHIRDLIIHTPAERKSGSYYFIDFTADRKFDLSESLDWDTFKDNLEDWLVKTLTIERTVLSFNSTINIENFGELERLKISQEKDIEETERLY